jgi:hypothetical protein
VRLSFIPIPTSFSVWPTRRDNFLFNDLSESCNDAVRNTHRSSVNIVYYTSVPAPTSVTIVTSCWLFLRGVHLVQQSSLLHNINGDTHATYSPKYVCGFSNWMTEDWSVHRTIRQSVAAVILCWISL